MGVLDTDRRVLALAMARMADAIGNSFLIIVLPGYVASGQVDVGALVGSRLPVVGEVTVPLLIGVVLSLFGLLNSVGQPFTGRLSDRTGRRKWFILVGLAAFGVSSALYPFVESYGAVVAIRAVQGVGAAFTIPGTIALVNEYSAADSERGGNFGVFNTFRLAGFGFGPIVAGFLVTGGVGAVASEGGGGAATAVAQYALPAVLGGGRVSGYTAAFGVAVLGAAVSLALVSVFVDDPENSGAEAGTDLSIAVRDRSGESYLDPVFVLGLGTFLMATGIAVFATLQAEINTALGQGSVLFSVQFAAVVVANVLFQVPIGSASDTYGRRPFIVGGFVLLVPSLLFQAYLVTPGAVSSPLLMVAGRLVQGVAVAMVFAPSLALAGDLARKGDSGTKLSVLTMAFGLGVAAGPTAAGFLVRYGLAVPFVFSAALGAGALVLVYTQVSDTVDAGLTLSPAD
ncbi:MAG: sugar phosphate permease [uncultured archaeon A07HB70]|nr:MAG: sugar phosphate permease [uncultured archaeon A07HB70]